jgi:hypothetical protein
LVDGARRAADAGHASALIAEQELGVGPALVFLTDQVLDGDADVFQEDVVDLVRAVDGDDRADGHARRLHVDQQERDAGLRLRGWIGADQTKDPVGVLRQRCPGLVPIDNVVIAVTHRLGANGGKIGAGARLRIALAPPVLAGEDTRQESLLLRVVAEGVDDGADHGDAERQWRHRACARHLLLEDEATGDRPAGPAVVLRPERRDPALFVQDAMPEQHLLLGKVGFRIGDVHLRRIIVLDERANLVAKRRIFRG